MDTLEFLVQGSSIEPYCVVFKKSGSNLTATCTCPAFENGQSCKHRIRILLGDLTDIISENYDDVAIVQNWLKGSDVEKALTHIQQAENEYEKAKKHLSDCKKQLSRYLRD